MQTYCLPELTVERTIIAKRVKSCLPTLTPPSFKRQKCLVPMPTQYQLLNPFKKLKSVHYSYKLRLEETDGSCMSVHYLQMTRILTTDP